MLEIFDQSVVDGTLFSSVAWWGGSISDWTNWSRKLVLSLAAVKGDFKVMVQRRMLSKQLPSWTTRTILSTTDWRDSLGDWDSCVVSVIASVDPSYRDLSACRTLPTSVTDRTMKVLTRPESRWCACIYVWFTNLACFRLCIFKCNFANLPWNFVIHSLIYILILRYYGNTSICS